MSVLPNISYKNKTEALRLSKEKIKKKIQKKKPLKFR